MVAANEQEELGRRERTYRDDRRPPGIAHRTVILVDDGLATGSTMRAAAAAIRVQRPEHLVAAVPVAPAETGSVLRSEVEAVICAVSPQPFFSVGSWYEDFSQTSDEEVRQLLQRAADSLTMFPCR